MSNVPPSLERFGDELHHAAVRELSGHSKPVRRRIPRPRLVAGGSLGLAGVGAGLVLALSGTAAAPAFAVTSSNDGSVLVNLDYNAKQNIPQVNAKLSAMGTNEQISIVMAAGAPSTSGSVACTPAAGTSGPQVNVLVGADGTETIAAGQSAGNTAEGSFHLVSCTTSSTSGSGSGTTTTG